MEYRYINIGIINDIKDFIKRDYENLKDKNITYAEMKKKIHTYASDIVYSGYSDLGTYIKKEMYKLLENEIGDLPLSR